jgi:hypothetical protein
VDGSQSQIDVAGTLNFNSIDGANQGALSPGLMQLTNTNSTVTGGEISASSDSHANRILLSLSGNSLTIGDSGLTSSYLHAGTGEFVLFQGSKGIYHAHDNKRTQIGCDDTLPNNFFTLLVYNSCSGEESALWVRAGASQGSASVLSIRNNADAEKFAVDDTGSVKSDAIKAPSGQHCTVTVDDTGTLGKTGCS